MPVDFVHKLATRCKAAGPIIHWNLPQVMENNGEPWRARTSDPLIKSAVTSIASGYGFYHLLTFVTGCSRQRVYLLLLINAALCVVLSQACLKTVAQLPAISGTAMTRQPCHFQSRPVLFRPDRTSSSLCQEELQRGRPRHDRHG